MQEDAARACQSPRTRVTPVVLVVIAAMMLVGLLNPVVARLEKFGLRRGAAITLVFFVLFAAALITVTLTIPELLTQAAALVEREPAPATAECANGDQETDSFSAVGFSEELVSHGARRGPKWRRRCKSSNCDAPGSVDIFRRCTTECGGGSCEPILRRAKGRPALLRGGALRPRCRDCRSWPIRHTSARRRPHSP